MRDTQNEILHSHTHLDLGTPGHHLSVQGQHGQQINKADVDQQKDARELLEVRYSPRVSKGLEKPLEYILK